MINPNFNDDEGYWRDPNDPSTWGAGELDVSGGGGRAPVSYTPRGYQIPGETVPMPGQLDLSKFMRELRGQGSSPAPGWYRDNSIGFGTPVYMGTPQLTSERNFIIDYFNKYGVLPTTGEAARGRSPMANDTYMLGSTPRDYGFHTPNEYFEAQRYGLGWGPHSGKDVPLESVVATDEKGNPFLRFTGDTPSERAQGFINRGQVIDKPNPTYYPQAQIPKPYTPPPEGIIRTNIMNSEALYGARLADYLDSEFARRTAGLEKGVDDDAIKAVAEELYQIRDKAEAMLDAGYTVEQFPLFSELSNAWVGFNTTPLYRKLINEYMAADRQRYDAASQQSARPRGGGIAGGVAPPQAAAAAQLSPLKAEYDAWVKTLNVSEASKIQMFENFDSFYNIWGKYGQGKPLVQWVIEYMGGTPGQQQPNPQRFAPNVRYR